MSEIDRYLRNDHFTSCVALPTMRPPSNQTSASLMVTTHNLGFPRIGAKRELKFALESYWKDESSRDELKSLDAQLRQRH